MPAYNAASYIGPAIKSVLAQTYSQWELIVVDDGSTDDTARQVAGYTDARIRLLQQANGGESVARNRALDAVRGEFLAFLDADDLWQPHHLTVTVGHLHRYIMHDGVYTDGRYCDTQSVPLERLSSRRRGPFAGDLFAELARASDVFGPPICVVLRSHAILQRQLRFDPEIVIGPDWDFLTRVAEFARFGYIDETTCLYRVHQANVTVRVDTSQRAASLARCREKTIRLARFAACPVETQVAVFYDLLVNLLPGRWEAQDAATAWPEFQRLPSLERARLLRLMASKGILISAPNRARRMRGDTPVATTADAAPFITHWLEQAVALNSRDAQARVLQTLYSLSPTICKLTVQMRRLLQPPDTTPASPFGKLV